MKRISGPRPLTPEYMKSVAKEYVFFISPSLADPNPTTILESMARGFPVICTPQSGYYEAEYIWNIHNGELNASIKKLKLLQTLSEDELVFRSNIAREVVKTKYNWQEFTDKIIENISNHD